MFERLNVNGLQRVSIALSCFGEKIIDNTNKLGEPAGVTPTTRFDN